MFQGISNFASLLKQAHQLGSQIARLSEELKTHRVSGHSGGDMVEIEMNGLLEATRCRIDPRLFKAEDRELVEDLVVAAINQAVAKGKQLHNEAIRKASSGLPIPDNLFDLVAKFGTAEPSETREPGETGPEAQT